MVRLSFHHCIISHDAFLIATLNRMAVQDFTYSNEVRIPKGYIIQAATNSIHHDSLFCPQTAEFQPWRFYKLGQKEHKGSSNYDAVTPGEEYFAWGRGKHAW